MLPVACSRVLVSLAFASSAFAAQTLERKYARHHAVVDWGRNIAKVQGSAPLSPKAGAAAEARARAAAMRDATANLVGLVKEIAPVAGSNSRRASMAAAVRRVAARSKVACASKAAEGKYEVTLCVALTGRGGLSAALASYLWKAPRGALMPPSKVATRDLPTTTGEEDLLTKADDKGPFTGVVIDARGFAIQTSMSPAVYDPQCKMIYDGAHADVDFVEDVGVVGYAGSIKAGKQVARLGKNPLVLRATGSPDQFHRCVALGKEDAGRLVDADKAAKFLKKCAVIFVIDNHAASSEKADIP